MKSIIIIFQMIIAVSLIVVILIQAKGVGLGKAWGGSGEFYKNRRGVEKILFNLTIIIALLFLVSSLFSLVLS